MASDRETVRGRIKELLGDSNPSEPIFGEFRYNDIINRNVYLIAGRATMPRTSVTSVSLVASTYEYTVASTVAQSVGQVFLNSNGDELNPVPWEQFNAYYKQDTAVPRASGTPREYTMREDTSNTLRFRFGPTPNATDTAKVHLSILPATLASDTTAIPFANDLVRALELTCAAEVVLVMDKARRQAAGLSPDVASKWLAASDAMVRDYNIRQAKLGTRQDHIYRGGGRRTHSFWGWA